MSKKDEFGIYPDDIFDMHPEEKSGDGESMADLVRGLSREIKEALDDTKKEVEDALKEGRECLDEALNDPYVEKDAEFRQYVMAFNTAEAAWNIVKTFGKILTGVLDINADSISKETDGD